jgi:hypothetical protein
MPDKTKIIVDDENDPGTWSNLANAINTAANAAYLLTAALGYPRCKERDEAVAYAAYQLDERVRETKDLFSKLFDEGRDEGERKMKVVG